MSNISKLAGTNSINTAYKAALKGFTKGSKLNSFSSKLNASLGTLPKDTFNKVSKEELSKITDLLGLAKK